jgi:hypothetical protein
VPTALATQDKKLAAVDAMQGGRDLTVTLRLSRMRTMDRCTLTLKVITPRTVCTGLRHLERSSKRCTLQRKSREDKKQSKCQRLQQRSRKLKMIRKTSMIAQAGAIQLVQVASQSHWPSKTRQVLMLRVLQGQQTTSPETCLQSLRFLSESATTWVKMASRLPFQEALPQNTAVCRAETEATTATRTMKAMILRPEGECSNLQSSHQSKLVLNKGKKVKQEYRQLQAASGLTRILQLFLSSLEQPLLAYQGKR